MYTYIYTYMCLYVSMHVLWLKWEASRAAFANRQATCL